MTQQPEWNWEGVSEAALRDLIDLAESHLTVLFQAAIAADQRAIAQAGILGAFGAALLATAATLAAEAEPAWEVIASFLVAGAGSVLAAFLSGVAARPTGFLPTGDEPSRIVSNAKDHIWMLRFVIQDMQRRIEHNRDVLEKNASVTNAATALAFASIVAAIVAYFLAAMIVR